MSVSESVYRYLSHRQIGKGDLSFQRTIFMTVEQTWTTGWWFWKREHRCEREFVLLKGEFSWRNESGNEVVYWFDEFLDGMLGMAEAKAELSKELDEEIAADNVVPIRRKTP